MSRPRRDIESPRGKRQKYTRSSDRERSSSGRSYKSGVRGSSSTSMVEPKKKERSNSYKPSDGEMNIEITLTNNNGKEEERTVVNNPRAN